MTGDNLIWGVCMLIDSTENTENGEHGEHFEYFEYLGYLEYENYLLSSSSTVNRHV